MRGSLSLVAGALLALHVLNVRAQPRGAGPSVLTDAIVFRGSELKGTENVDVYVAVPYQLMQFQEIDARFAATFTARIAIRDSIGRRLADTSVSRSVIVEDEAAANGSTGKAETIVVRMPLKPGSYRREVSVTDGFSHREMTSTDTLLVPDLTLTPTLSSIMYLRDIEQRGERYRISPYVGYTIWSGETMLFAFYEVYQDELPLTAAFSWNVSAADGRSIGKGIGEPVTIERRVSQHFLPMRPIERALPGSYLLTVNMHPVANGLVDTTTILASRVRRYLVPRSAENAMITDLSLAIRQLIYVAEQDEIDAITGSANPADRQYRFEEFWKKRDPSPTTVRNEAYEEYYARIETANKRFKSYTEGWLTDMGRVYVIYGEPGGIDRFNSSNGITTVVRWTYGNSLVFNFEDNTGFGDYRLRSPLPPNAKYEYRR